MCEAEKISKSGGRLPRWLKRPLGSGEKFNRVVGVLGGLDLATVCDEAGCPNRGECYSTGTATFMIMGKVCTRNCEFCLVQHGKAAALRADEPKRVAAAAARLQLQHVVITSVTRDDLADGGAEHFARTVGAIRQRQPEATIEVLTPDFKGDRFCLDMVCAAGPDVFNHNLETVRRLSREIRRGADYDRSLGVLGYVAGKENHPVVKSGLMVGLGEDKQEIVEALADLRRVGVEMVTIGQYLRPSKRNRQVHKFYQPEEFDEFGRMAEKIGFGQVVAGPFVRSSYHAEKTVKKLKVEGEAHGIKGDG